MEFLLHNNEGIEFPAIHPLYTDGELFFKRFRALTPWGDHGSVIGEGGTGMIHLVRDELMDRIVALKLPHPSVMRDKSTREEVIQETRQAIELTHPHIVRIYDFYEGAEGWGISMQYVRGKNLDEWRHEGRSSSRRGPVAYSVERIERWVAQLCDALIYAHEDAGMVHRDIKPKNLMLERRYDGHEKLLLTDFGITQRLRKHTMLLSKVQPGSNDKNTVGTLPYMPWEQIQGGGLPSTLEDVYAVGATIYELLTGRPPFFEGGYEQIQVQIEKVVPPTMAERLDQFDLPDHGIPRAWEETVAACLAKRPEDRPQSIREVATRLGLVSSSLGNAIASGHRNPADTSLIHPDLQQRSEEIEALKMEMAQSQKRTEELTQEAAANLAAYEATWAELDQSRAEIVLLNSRIEESGGRIGELERTISENQTAVAAAGNHSEALGAELASLAQTLEQARSDGARWKESYESLEKGLEGEQKEMLSRLQAEIGEKEQRLTEARSHHEQTRRSLVELQQQHAAALQHRATLEADLASAQAAAGAGTEEIEQRFQAELESLRTAVETAQNQTQTAQKQVEAAETAARQQIEQARSTAQEQAKAAEMSARQQIEEARSTAQQTANKNAEQALAAARSQSEAAQKEAAKATEEARRANTAAEAAREKLDSLKDRQSASLMPLLYVLIAALVIGGGAGIALGKFGRKGGTTTNAVTTANLEPFSACIPENPGSAGKPVNTGLFKAYLSDQKVPVSEGVKLVPGLDSMADDAPVTGVSWWVAENFCAWLSSRNPGKSFQIASAAEIQKAGRDNASPAEWTSEAGDANDSPAGARKIVSDDAKDGTSQMPSMSTSKAGAKLGFRVTLTGS